MRTRMRRLLWGMLFIFSSLELFSAIDERFFSDIKSTAALDGVQALWYNPAGLSFLDGSEGIGAYLYEWHDSGRRQHFSTTAAFSFLDLLSVSGGLNGRFGPSSSLGSDLTGIIGLSFKATEKLSFGLSFLKSYYMEKNASKDMMVSFGFQARPSSYLAVGGLYQEVNEGYFNAPNLSFGLGLRPFGDDITFLLDAHFSPKGISWRDGFRFDPMIGLKAYFGGLGVLFSTEIPGIIDGFQNPIFFAGIELNFAHLGLSLSSNILPSKNSYSIGSHIRTSSVEWRSFDRPSGLWVELSIDEKGRIDTKTDMMASFFGQEQNPLEVVALLRRLRDDRSIAGITFHFKGFSFGDGRTEEWRNALKSLREAGKTVVVYLDRPSERDYYVATAANTIYMYGKGSLSLDRFQSTLDYLGETLEKIGIKAESIAAGNYKTAPRMWTHNKPAKEELLVQENILQNFYQSFIDRVSESRNIDKAKLKELFDSGEITAARAKEAGLIDDTIYSEEVASTLIGDKNAQLPLWPDYDQRELKKVSWAKPQKIVVIPINGEIVDGRASVGPFSFMGVQTGAQDVIELLNDLSEDSEVAGIVVRINSPGGDAEAGDKIHHAISKAAEKKVVVASMSDYAASAGYLIATAAHHVIAQTHTLTGSIGVFSLHFSGEKLARKLGINVTEFSAIKNPGPTLARQFSAAEREQAQKVVDWYYDNFISTVANSMKLEESHVRSYAHGHVWLGKEALDKKLVHALGGFNEAIDSVRLLAKIPENRDFDVIIAEPGSKENFQILPNLIGMKDVLRKVSTATSLFAPYLKDVMLYQQQGVPLARLPYNVSWTY